MTCETQFILVCRSRISNRQKITHTIREELKLDNVDLLPLELLDTREILIFLPKSMALKMFTISVKELTIKITLANHVCALPWSTQEPSNGIRCLCEDILSKLEKVLLLRNVRFLTLKSFEDKAFLRDKDGFKNIEYGFVNKVKELELDLDRITSLLSETCFEGCEAYNGMITEQHTASSSLSRIAKLWSDYQFTIKKFHSLEGELRVVREFGESGVEDHEKSEDLHDQQSEESIYKIQEGYKSSQNSLRINEGTSRSECNSGERIPFPHLLETISKSLTPKDWVRLREEISYDPPFAGIDQFQNGIEIFNQLHRIRIIDENKVDYIRRLFYSIERVDLVHVIDCCGEGDYRSLSFLNELPQTQTQVNAGKKETQNNGRDSTTKIPSPEDDSYPTEPQQAAHNSRELQEGEGPSDATNCTGVHNLHHSMLAKEHTEESSRVFEEDGDTLKQHEHPEVSCEHYDRFCTAKFGCCGEFWACHRCHNAKSKCGKKKLRSLDIESIKCNRCGKVQEVRFTSFE